MGLVGVAGGTGKLRQAAIIDMAISDEPGLFDDVKTDDVVDEEKLNEKLFDPDETEVSKC